MSATLVEAPAQGSRHQGIASVAEIVNDRLVRAAAGPVIRYDDGVDYRDVDQVEYANNMLRGMALLAGHDRQVVVGTFVRNRPEWDLVALSALYTGNILFPLDPKTPDDELAHLLTVSPPDMLLVSRATHARMSRVLASIDQHPAVVVADLYVTFEDQGAPEVPTGVTRLSSIPPVEALPEPSVRLDDPDLVLGHYATSGTTSLPRIVRITHGNILAQVNEGMDVMTLRGSEDLLNLGPYSHIATLLEFLVTKARRYTVTYFTREPDEDGVLEAEIKKLRRRGVKIRALMAVPKFWVFLMKEVLDEMRGKSIWRSLYTELVDIERHSQLHDLGTLDKAKLNAIRIFLRNRMGGHFTFGISSSSRIDPGVVTIFAKLGVTVIDIYGATEASGIVARNRLNESRTGSCGRIIAGVEHRIGHPRWVPGHAAPVGVLELRGPTLARGYVGRPEDGHLTSDGWYCTGDLARVDEEGWVYLVGREAELVHWSDGSLVDRMHLSNLLVRSIWIKDAMVTQLEEDPFLSVFVLPDRERMDRDLAFRAELEAGISEEHGIRSRLVAAIGWAQAVSGISAPIGTERIYLLAQPLERTPTHKIRFSRELARLDLTRWL